MSNIKLRALTSLAVVTLVGMAGLQAGCASRNGEGANEAADEVSSSGTPEVGSPGSHVAGHGMVLFGKERVYLSHIPLFNQPHNMQVLFEAKVVAGVPEGQVFDNKQYTVAPKPFSLYDLAAGTLAGFEGTIFEGNFESGGRPIFRNVKFEVVRVVFHQGLFPTAPRSATLDYIAVGTPTDPYLVHVIDDRASFDQIVGFRFGPVALGAEALETGSFVTVEGGVNAVQNRLAARGIVTVVPTKTGELQIQTNDAPFDAGVDVDAEAPSDAGVPDAQVEVDASAPVSDDVKLQVRGEYSCLLGPDFFRPCPQAIAPTH